MKYGKSLYSSRRGVKGDEFILIPSQLLCSALRLLCVHRKYNLISLGSTDHRMKVLLIFFDEKYYASI